MPDLPKETQPGSERVKLGPDFVDLTSQLIKIREGHKLGSYKLSAAQMDGLDQHCARFAKRAP